VRFLFVDRILRLDPGREAVVHKNVSNSEDFFSDHFVGRPVMPGCLILETCDQAARLLLAAAADFGRLPGLAGVTNVKFQHFVQPGDTLEVRAEVVGAAGPGATVRATAAVEGRPVARMTLKYGFTAAAADPAAARACRRMRDFYEQLTTSPLDPVRERGAAGGTGGEANGG
jgi:3-hydroxyacyl-[acyl-carrier-protein] dehydratase